MADLKHTQIQHDRLRLNQVIDGLTLFDDDLMSRVFDHNIKATELLLRIILGKDIRVLRVNGQEEFRNPEIGGRDITLDVHALNENGEEINIEVQGNSEGAHILYVNGNYKGNDEIGQLMRDFHQMDPGKIHYEELAQSIKHFKNAEKGRDDMSQIVEEYAKEYAKECVDEYSLNIVRNLIKNTHFTLEQALDAAGIQGEDRALILKRFAE